MTRLGVIVMVLAWPVMALAQTEAAPSVPDTCGAAGLSGLIGQTGEIARLLEFEDGKLRVLPPNSIVTLDFRPERMNIHLDEEDVIIRIECG